VLIRVLKTHEVDVLNAWGGDPGRKHVLANFLNREAQGLRAPRLFADDPDDPRLLVAVHGARICVHGPRRETLRLLRSLFRRVPESIPGWPDNCARSDWAATQDGRPFLYFAGNYASYREDMARLGFIPNHEDILRRRPHFYYWLSSAPCCSRFVQHPCRLGVGQELHSLLLTGIGYDETGEYTRACLENGPSVVCELRHAGRVIPVCWSATHLSGAIGMIHTPPRFRGRGYGSSLTAFHTDIMLERDGIAFAQVRWDNYHSQRMFEKLGYRRTREPITGAAFYWPGVQE
jgi:ribosomal protein S18 acetylase RimI-like enzyme